LIYIELRPQATTQKTSRHKPSKGREGKREREGNAHSECETTNPIIKQTNKRH
jgi:hypothetical protein